MLPGPLAKVVNYFSDILPINRVGSHQMFNALNSNQDPFKTET